MLLDINKLVECFLILYIANYIKHLFTLSWCLASTCIFLFVRHYFVITLIFGLNNWLKRVRFYRKITIFWTFIINRHQFRDSDFQNAFSRDIEIANCFFLPKFNFFSAKSHHFADSSFKNSLVIFDKYSKRWLLCNWTPLSIWSF